MELLEDDNYDFDSIHQLFNNIGDNCCSCFDKYYQNYIEIAKEKNASNLLLLNELGIQNLSSLVIYNFNSTSDFAIRLDSLNDFQLIKSLIESTSIQDTLKQQEINY